MKIRSSMLRSFPRARRAVVSEITRSFVGSTGYRMLLILSPDFDGVRCFTRDDPRERVWICRQDGGIYRLDFSSCSDVAALEGQR